MPDVLPVAAFQIGDPIAMFVLVETDDALFHGVFGVDCCGINYFRFS